MSVKELLILVPCHSLEDFPTELGDEPAAGLLNAFAVVFHPLLIAAAESFPRYVRADEPSPVTPGQLIILPVASQDWLPHGWAEQARRDGAHVVSGETQRDTLLAAALAPLAETGQPEIDPELVADFLALGTVYLQTELLTRHMRNYGHLEEDQMLRELLAGARAAIAGDAAASRSHLKRCFEMLLSCRERFYPVECHLIDLCLVIPRLANDSLGELLKSDVPVNLLAQGCDWEEILEAHPEWQELIREGWKQDRLELVGGDWRDRPTTLMSLDAQMDELSRGHHWYHAQFDRAPTVWARKRFGVGPHMPQVLHRLGYVGALHFVMDDGIYPDEEQANLRWQGSDGSMVEACSRIPLAGDSASSMLRFPVRMAESMDYDHVAGVVFARWPEQRTPWLDDFRRAQKYAPVLGKFTTLHEFFHATDTHGAITEFAAGRYLTPFLVQSVARRDADPVSRYVKYWELQRRFQRVDWCQRVAELFSTAELGLSSDRTLDDLIREADPDATAEQQAAASEAVDQAEQKARNNITRVLTGAEAGAGAGLLVVNPHSFARQVLVDWPEGTAPGQEKAIRHRQVNEQSSAAVVDVPACGFQWLSTAPRKEASETPVGKMPMAEELTLRTDTFEVEMSNMTGGIAQIRTYRRSPNRLSQQLAFRFPHERTYKTTDGEETRDVRSYYSEMQLRDSEIIAAGPTFGCIETRGDLVDTVQNRMLAHYRQRCTVYRGQSIIRVELELDTLKQPEGDPWTNYFCSRFAWKQESAALSGSMQEGAHLITAPRIEAPQFIEIADDSYRTTIHTRGLPFHRKTGDRMLDSVLITEGENARKFEFVISIDENYPLQRTLDAFSPPLVIPTQSAPPKGGHSGWLFHVGAPNVQLTRLLPAPPPAAGMAKEGFVIRLQETEGRHRTVPVQCFRAPSYARQIDLKGETISTVPLDGESLNLDMASFEVCDIEVRFE